MRAAADSLRARAAGLPAALLLAGLLLLGAVPAWAAGEDLYAVEPAPMTVAECGRCHVVHFQALKADGGKHRFACQECHRIFHAYNPRRDNFAALMPQCGQCHNLPHGTRFTECLSCHDNPHAALRLAGMPKLAQHCGECHVGPAEELAKFPSAHTRQGCDSCHSERHGRIPQCGECHQPHFAEQPATACLGCHPVHRPLQISFTPDADPQNCKECHTAAFSHWTATRSKHGKVSCATCHTRHGLIPKCTDCHDVPHDAKMMARFPACLDCHLDPHNPPIK